MNSGREPIAVMLKALKQEDIDFLTRRENVGNCLSVPRLEGAPNSGTFSPQEVHHLAGCYTCQETLKRLGAIQSPERSTFPRAVGIDDPPHRMRERGPSILTGVVWLVVISIIGPNLFIAAKSHATAPLLAGTLLLSLALFFQFSSCLGPLSTHGFERWSRVLGLYGLAAAALIPAIVGLSRRTDVTQVKPSAATTNSTPPTDLPAWAGQSQKAGISIVSVGGEGVNEVGTIKIPQTADVTLNAPRVPAGARLYLVVVRAGTDSCSVVGPATTSDISGHYILRGVDFPPTTRVHFFAIASTGSLPRGVASCTSISERALFASAPANLAVIRSPIIVGDAPHINITRVGSQLMTSRDERVQLMMAKQGDPIEVGTSVLPPEGAVIMILTRPLGTTRGS